MTHCPKCDKYLILEEQTDQCYDVDSYSETWSVFCPVCDYSGSLTQVYVLSYETLEEDDNEESHN